jgi:hypothetical protein
MMYHKKKLMREQVLPDLDARIERLIDSRITEIRAEHPVIIEPTGDGPKKESVVKRAHTLFDPHSRRILIPAAPTKNKEAPLLNKVVVFDTIEEKKV